MARTTATQVLGILKTQVTAETVELFMADASLWVTEELVVKGLSTDRLELIERYLTCALVRLRDLGLTSVKMDDVTEHYQVDPQVSDYLLRAASFDPSGTVRRTFVPPKDVRVASAVVGRGFVGDNP